MASGFFFFSPAASFLFLSCLSSSLISDLVFLQVEIDGRDMGWIELGLLVFWDWVVWIWLELCEVWFR